jgi:isocitrate dehydrogenase kinase/phosphatase
MPNVPVTTLVKNNRAATAAITILIILSAFPRFFFMLSVFVPQNYLTWLTDLVTLVTMAIIL